MFAIRQMKNSLKQSEPLIFEGADHVASLANGSCTQLQPNKDALSGKKTHLSNLMAEPILHGCATNSDVTFAPAARTALLEFPERIWRSSWRATKGMKQLDVTPN